MEMWNKKFFKERVLHYWSKVHGQQLNLSHDYRLLKPTISISLLNYVEFPDEFIGYNKFILKEDFYQNFRAG
jgi:predicted transposase/invertase (TIGR01784 family)